jgi:hypothetical protein
MLSPFRPFLLTVAAVFAVQPLTVMALENLSFDNVRVEAPDGKGSVLFKHIDFFDTNLSRDDASKLFAVGLSKDEYIAIISKAQAKRIAIPEITVEPKGDQTSGAITVRAYEVLGLDGGRFQKASISGFDGTVTSKAGTGTVKSGPIVLEDGDFSKLIAAVKDGDVANGVARLGKFSWTGFDLQVPDKDTPASAPGGNLYKIAMASLVGSTTYDGDTPMQSKGDVKGISFEPPKASEAGRTLVKFGYDRVEGGATLNGNYDAAKKTYSLVDYTITGVNAGSLGFSGNFGNIEKGAFVGSKDERLAALTRGDVSDVTMRFVNQGLFDKAVEFYAASVNRKAADVKGEWAVAVTGMLPMMLGGDPSALKMAEAVNTFIRDPKSLTVSLKGKNGPVRFMDAMSLRDPVAFLSKVQVTTTANQ